MTRLRFRVTDLTTIGTSTGAQLKILPTPTGSASSDGLVLNAPSLSTGGGINATLRPTFFAGLDPGESIDVELTMQIVQGGSFRFASTTEDDLEPFTAPVAARDEEDHEEAVRDARAAEQAQGQGPQTGQALRHEEEDDHQREGVTMSSDEQFPATSEPYEPPAIEVLGTLADLTQGGNVDGSPDGFGFSGDSGSV